MALSNYGDSWFNRARRHWNQYGHLYRRAWNRVRKSRRNRRPIEANRFRRVIKRYSGRLGAPESSREIRPTLGETTQARKRGRFAEPEASNDELRRVSSSMSLNQYNVVTKDWTNRPESRRHKAKRLRDVARIVREMNQTVEVNKFIRYSTGAITTLAGEQTISVLPALCGLWGTANVNDDLKTIAGEMPPPAATGQNWPAYNGYDLKMLVQSAQQTLELTNNSSTVPVYIDVYKCVCTKFNESGGPYITGAISKWAAATAVTTASIGVTPFDLKEFTEFSKILSKESVYLAPSQNFEMKFSAKGFVYDGAVINNMSGNDSWGLPGHTHFLLLVQTGALTSASTAAASTTQYLVTNKYRVKPWFSVTGGAVQTVQSF